MNKEKEYYCKRVDTWVFKPLSYDNFIKKEKVYIRVAEGELELEIKDNKMLLYAGNGFRFFRIEQLDLTEDNYYILLSKCKEAFLKKPIHFYEEFIECESKASKSEFDKEQDND